MLCSPLQDPRDGVLPRQAIARRPGMKPTVKKLTRERRVARRRKLKTGLRIRLWKNGTAEERGESVNVSASGIYFATDSRLREGETVEVLFEMPRDITGEPPTEWRCTGHVVRVDSEG